jgi:hypothetical protein
MMGRRRKNRYYPPEDPSPIMDKIAYWLENTTRHEFAMHCIVILAIVFTILGILKLLNVIQIGK